MGKILVVARLVEPDPAEMAQRYGPETTVPDWRKRLVCSRCGSHDTDMVVTGEAAETKKPRWGEPGFRRTDDPDRGNP
jgi:hypothetical protein